MGLTSFSSSSSFSPFTRGPGRPPRCRTRPQRCPKFPKCDRGSGRTCSSRKGGQHRRGKVEARPRSLLLDPSLPGSMARPLSGSLGLCRLNGGRSGARVSQRASCTPRSPHGAVTASKLPPGGRQRLLLRRYPGGLRPHGLPPTPSSASPTRPHIHTVAHTFARSRGIPAPLSLPPGAQRLGSGSLAAHGASSARNLRTAGLGPPRRPALELGGRANVPRPIADGSPYRRDAALESPSSYSLKTAALHKYLFGGCEAKAWFRRVKGTAAPEESLSVPGTHQEDPINVKQNSQKHAQTLLAFYPFLLTSLMSVPPPQLD